MVNVSPEDNLIKTPAGFWRRLGAGMSDFILCLGLYTLLCLGALEVLNYQKSDLQFDLYGQVIPCFFAFYFIYGLFLEILPPRATVGKAIFRIRICNRNGNPAGLVPVILRNLAKWLSLLTAGIGFLLCAFRKDGLTLHDLISGSTVMRVETREGLSARPDRPTGIVKGKIGCDRPGEGLRGLAGRQRD